MFNRTITTQLAILALSIGHAQQPPSIVWQSSFGGSDGDVPRSIHETVDGGFIVAGTTGSTDGDVATNQGGIDIWVVRSDPNGNLLWEETYGGSGTEFAYSIEQTFDDGFIVAGSTSSTNGDISSNLGGVDLWVIRIDTMGNLLWERTYGGTSGDLAYSIQQVHDSGFVAVGVTRSNDGQVTGYHGSKDIWVIRLDASGNLIWQKALGGSSEDEAWSIQQTSDLGFVLTGSSTSQDGDVTGFQGWRDVWVVKLDSLGGMEWQRTLGGSDLDVSGFVRETADGSFLIAGATSSSDGDVTGYQGGIDAWVVKLNSLGGLIWQRSLGGSAQDAAYSLVLTADQGCIVAGHTRSNDGDVTANNGGDDYWVFELDSLGVLLWERSFGGSDHDLGWSIDQTTDGGVVVAGWSASNDMDVSGNQGNEDFWLIKLGGLSTTVANGFSTQVWVSVAPNPNNGDMTVSTGEFEHGIITLTNTLGESCFSRKIEAGSTQLCLSDIPRGLYFLTLRTDTAIRSQRILIQ